MSVLVIATAACILYFVNRSILQSNFESDDIRKMRDIIGAIDLYESQNDELPPLELSAMERDVGEKATFVSSNDPFTLGNDFPEDPAFPDSTARSHFRISFTYLPQWILNGKVKAHDWRSVYGDSKIGLISCYWYGNTSQLRRDGLDSDGPVIRVNMDGSARWVPLNKHQGLLTSKELFNLE